MSDNHALAAKIEQLESEIERLQAGRKVERTMLRNLVPRLTELETEIERLTTERDAALDALGRIGGVLFMHSHADTCAVELSPNAGYECNCWRAGIYAALGGDAMSDPVPMSDAELAERLRATSLRMKAEIAERQKRAVVAVLMANKEERSSDVLADVILAAIKATR